MLPQRDDQNAYVFPFLQDKNNKLYKELNLQKSLNNQLESLLTKNQSEISRMQRIIG